MYHLPQQANALRCDGQTGAIPIYLRFHVVDAKLHNIANRMLVGLQY